MTDHELHPETKAIRAGRGDNDTALAPILWATTTFVTPTVAEGRKMATGIGSARFYSRYGNPTVAGFEDAIAQLEGAETARAFASGMGAISAVILGMSPSSMPQSREHSLPRSFPGARHLSSPRHRRIRASILSISTNSARSRDR